MQIPEYDGESYTMRDVDYDETFLRAFELKDVKRRLKLTEYIMYNKAKHKMKLEELGKDELYEYMKKEDKKD